MGILSNEVIRNLRFAIFEQMSFHTKENQFSDGLCVWSKLLFFNSLLTLFQSNDFINAAVFQINEQTLKLFSDFMRFFFLNEHKIIILKKKETLVETVKSR